MFYDRIGTSVIINRTDGYIALASKDLDDVITADGGSNTGRARAGDDAVGGCNGIGAPGDAGDVTVSTAVWGTIDLRHGHFGPSQAPPAPAAWGLSGMQTRLKVRLSPPGTSTSVEVPGRD